MRFKWVGVVALSALLHLVNPGAARADAIFDVTIDTSTFGGPLYMLFQLTDGGNTVQNSVTLSNFTFGGGVLEGAPIFEGAASGDFAQQVFLSDMLFLNFVQQAFTPGLVLGFRVRTTSLFEDGAVPDLFAFSIFDAAGTPIGTSDPETGALLTLDIVGDDPVVNNFGVTVSRVTERVPEPGTLLLMATALGCAAGRRLVRKRRVN